MYRTQPVQETTLTVNESTEGETIEQKIERVVNNGEPITDGAPMVYTERKDGVLPAYDPRTDRFEIAVDAMDRVTASRLAKRDGNIVDMPKKDTKNDGDSVQNSGDSQGEK